MGGVMHLGRIGAGVCLAVAVATAGRAAPLEAYGQLPTVDNIDISPDGKNIAFATDRKSVV